MQEDLKRYTLDVEPIKESVINQDRVVQLFKIFKVLKCHYRPHVGMNIVKSIHPLESYTSVSLSLASIFGTDDSRGYDSKSYPRKV